MKPINHPQLGGNVVDTTRDFTQKKPKRNITEGAVLLEEALKKLNE